MSFFDDSHVMDLPLSEPPLKSVSFGEAVSIGYDQQFRVDSPFSLEQEIENIWSKQLEAYQRATGETVDHPGDLRALGQYARAVKGMDQTFWSKTIGGDIAPLTQQNIEKIRAVDEKILALGNPEIKSFEEVLAEVIAMQREVEKRTGEASQGADELATLGLFLGQMGGAFSGRDPLTLATLGVGGAGRTVTARIGTEMGLAGGVAAVTDAGAVNPARDVAGLERRSVLQDALFAAAGAGLFQGGAEVVAKLAQRMVPLDRKLARALERAEPIDLQDDVTRAFLSVNEHSPRARAGLSILDDVEAIEAASPYGTSYTGVQRFLGELAEVQRVLGNEPQTAVARFLAPIPFEQVERQVDFQIVKERSPQIWARLEEAQARLAQDKSNRSDLLEQVRTGNSKKLQDELDYFTQEIGDREYEYDELSALFDILDRAEQKGGDKTLLKQSRQKLIDLGFYRPMSENEIKNTFSTSGKQVWEFQQNGIKYTTDEVVDDWQFPETRKISSKDRREANAEYREALAAVERERDAINRVEALVKGKGEADAADFLGHAMRGRPFIGSALTHDVVEQQMVRVTDIAERADEITLAQIRMLEDPEGRVDIGLEEPVDGDFRILTEDGEMSYKEILDDLKEDERLDEAMRSCLL